MFRFLTCLALLAAPAAAQDEVTGRCQDGAAWAGGPIGAGFGPCENPYEGTLILICEAGATTMIVDSPYPVGAGNRGTVDLSVDGRDWRLEGTGTLIERTGTEGLEAPVPADALDALAAGSRARLDMPSETLPMHLAGSGAAIAALRASCQEG